MESKLILAFHVAPQKLGKIRFCAMKMAIGGEMLYFAFPELPLVDRFLTTMKQMRVPPVRLKGVMTETNLGWTPVALYQELTREHQAMTGNGAPIHAAKQEE